MGAARRSAAAASRWRFIAHLATPLAFTVIGSAAAVDRAFLSGAAVTAHLFSTGGPAGDGTSVARHHLVCFHRGGGYASSVAEGRQKCCHELYQNGLLRRDDRGYCLDRVALVTDLVAEGRGNGVRPAFYLALDEPTVDAKEASKSYRQRRQLKVFEDKEKETLRDGNQGVWAFSPFHLVGFTSDGSHVNTEKVLTLEGRVEGAVSSEGGMHRAFRQGVTLSLSNVMRVAKNGSSQHRVTVNATILLPISESVFIDADDPLLVEFEGGLADGTTCRSTAESSKMAVRKSSSTCSIDFVHPEIIDIEQPAFASRQHVVAYQISATLDLTLDPNDANSDERDSGLEVAVEYGTTLHIRYPPPIAANDDGGLVPVAIQQPVLYSASASLEAPNEESYAAFHYNLRTNEASQHPPDPIVIRVAAGLGGDYGWVTFVTMTSALIGGLMLMRSLDSVSLWC